MKDNYARCGICDKKADTLLNLGYGTSIYICGEVDCIEKATNNTTEINWKEYLKGTEDITDKINWKYSCRGSFVLHTRFCPNNVEYEYSMCDECRNGVTHWRESRKVLEKFKDLLCK